MSGLYNLMIADGKEEERGTLLGGAILGLQRDEFGRFRDAWLELDEGGEPRIAIYTRNGGGNRPDYEDVTEALREHPLYLSDADDTFDSTYATYYFRFPTEKPEHLDWEEEVWRQASQIILETAHQKPVDMSVIWQAAIDRLQQEGPTEEQAAALAPLAQALGDALEGGAPQIITLGRDPKRFT